MTNSAKWAWYAPANLGFDVVFGSLDECVRSASLGRVWRDPDLWGDGCLRAERSSPAARRASPSSSRNRSASGEASIPTPATLIDTHHPQRGASVTGRILVMPSGRGSSSSSYVLAEAIRAGTAPAAIVLRRDRRHRGARRDRGS